MGIMASAVQTSLGSRRELYLVTLRPGEVAASSAVRSKLRFAKANKGKSNQSVEA